MRIRIGAASATLAASLSLLVAVAPVAAADPPVDPSPPLLIAPAPIGTAGTPIARAVAYLFEQQGADGSLAGSAGATEDYILGAAAGGFDPATLVACGGNSALGYLEARVATESASPGKLAKLILAVVAAHRDPASFGGTDLLSALAADDSSGTGRYGDGATFTQSLAILALDAAGRSIPAAAATALAGLQNKDGSWSYGTAADAIAGDTNSTAIAVMALAAAESTTPVTPALAWLHGQQLADGGFPYQGGAGAVSDPDSNAIVIQALVAAGESPDGAAWTKGANTPASNLLSMQAADGGFAYPGSTSTDAFTTSQVPAGLAGVPPNARMEWTVGRAPAARDCSAPSPTTTPGATLPATSTDSVGPARGGQGSPSLPAALVLLAMLGGVVLAARRPARR